MAPNVEIPNEATRRLQSKKQNLDDAYAAPANFLEIDVVNPITHGVARGRYTDYEVRMKTNLPVFKLKDSSVRRRYSDFEWLRSELERDSKIVVPPLPGKAWKRQLLFRSDDGLFEEGFVEDRRKGLETFINKVAGHPLAQNERCLHMFLQEPSIDKNYVPGIPIMSHQREITKYLKLISAKKLERNHKECIELYHAIGGIYSEIGSYDEAAHHHEQALELCNTLGDRLGTAVASRFIGEAKAAMGNFNQAIEFIKKYLELAEKLKNKVETQRAWTTLGRVYLMKAQELKDRSNIIDKETKEAAREAEKKFQTALNLAESVRDRVDEKEYAQMTSGLLINLGLVKDICGQHAEAVAKFNRATEICRAAKLKEDLYRCQNILTGIYRQRNEVKLAVKVSEEALQTAKSIGKKVLVCDALIERGQVRICQRDFKNAKRTFAQAYLEKSPSEEDHSKAIRLTKLAALITFAYEKICKDNAPSDSRLKLCDKLGDLFVAIGNYKLAVEYYRRAFSDAKVCSKPKSELARILFSVAETYADDGQFEHALVCYEKELTYREGNDAEQCQSLIKIAHMHEYLERDSSTVSQAYERALKKAGEEPKLLHNVLRYYVPYLRQKSFNAIRYRELEQKLENLKSYPEVIEDVETEDHEEANELEDEIANVNDVITDDEDNDEVLMVGRRRARGKNKFKANEVGDTPLHEACIKGDFKRVKSLVAQGHDINPRDNAGWLPIHEACNHGYYDIAEFLIEHGADLNNRGLKGMSPLHDAATNGHFDIMRLLIKNGANVICLTDTGETVLGCLRDYKTRNFHKMSNSEASEYKQIEAELLNAMDRCGYNLMNENLKNLGSSKDSRASASALMTQPEPQQQPRPQQQPTRQRKIHEPQRARQKVRIETEQALISTKPTPGPIREYREAITTMKRKRPLDVSQPNKRASQPATITTNVSTSVSTKDWLLSDDIVEEEEEEENMDLDEHITKGRAIKTHIISDDDDDDNEVQEISQDIATNLSKDLRPCSPASMTSFRSDSFHRSASTTPSEGSIQPVSVAIEGRKLLIPLKRTTTVAELKTSVVERFSVLVDAKPKISLAPSDDPDCLLFDHDLCQDVIRSNCAGLVAIIDSWQLDSIESTYLKECRLADVEPVNFIKIEMRGIDENDSRLDFARLKFPRAHLKPISRSLARRNFSYASFQGSSWWFDCQRFTQELLGSTLFTWSKLTRLNLRCAGLMKFHFELLCNSKSRLPELQQIDLSVNSIVYKAEGDFTTQVERLRLVCSSGGGGCDSAGASSKLKKLDMRKNHLLFVNKAASTVDLNAIEIHVADQYAYTVYADA